MELDIYIVVFYLLALDSMIANIIAWGARGWYIKHLQPVSRWLPLTRAWAAFYLGLVIWIGILTFLPA